MNVNAFMIENLPPKLANPGSFSIPVTVGNISVDRALCDLVTPEFPLVLYDFGFVKGFVKGSKIQGCYRPRC